MRFLEGTPHPRQPAKDNLIKAVQSDKTEMLLLEHQNLMPHRNVFSGKALRRLENRSQYIKQNSEICSYPKPAWPGSIGLSCGMK
jgi:hypothetical protein